MANGRTKFPATNRRINFLRQELYNYDKFFRDPANDIDIGKHAKFAIDAEEHQVELDELMYLLELAEKATQPTCIRRWQVALVVLCSITALILAAVSLWLSIT